MPTLARAERAGSRTYCDPWQCIRARGLPCATLSRILEVGSCPSGPLLFLPFTFHHLVPSDLPVLTMAHELNSYHYLSSAATVHRSEGPREHQHSLPISPSGQQSSENPFATPTALSRAHSRGTSIISSQRMPLSAPQTSYPRTESSQPSMGADLTVYSFLRSGYSATQVQELTADTRRVSLL